MLESSAISLSDWLDSVSRQRGDAAAVSGVNEPVISYSELSKQTADAAQALRGWGLGRNDVVLLAISDGPAALWAFLSVIRVATAFPVSPSDQPEEYARLIEMSKAKAIIIEDRPHAALAALAASRGLIFIRLGKGAAYTLSSESPLRAKEEEAPAADDVAVLTLTSGTSARPKIVASTQLSLATSVRHVATWLELGTLDRALCIMPFMHLHSLVRTTLPVLWAGGHAVWAPGFDRRQVLGWISHFRPTYLTAVPSMYRTILEEIESRGGAAGGESLRLIGLGSDRVDDQLVKKLQSVFAAHIFQFYGLTETCPFIAMTPLHNDDMPAGAVGTINPIWEVQVVDEFGTPLPLGSEGEIVARGGIFNSVLGDEHKQTIIDGWFHTKDVGRLDGKAMLYVTGRIGDRIVRGGKKIEPQAVEEAISAHPAVKEVVAFGLPDRILGQRVAAAVVLRPDGPAEVDEILEFSETRLNAFMVPEQIFIIDEIPVSSRGKVSRSAMSERFAAAVARPADENPAESKNPELVEKVLQIFQRYATGPTLAATDDFFLRGGADSFAALSAILDIEKALQVSVAPATLRRRPSAVALSNYLEDQEQRRAASPLSLVPVRISGRRTPLFLTHGVDGRNSYAAEIVRLIEDDQPVYTFHRTRPESEPSDRKLKAMANRQAALILEAQGDGPYNILGHSFGARLAFEIAQSLLAQGGEVSFLGLVDDRSDLDQRHFGLDNQPPAHGFVYGNNLWALNCNVVDAYPGEITCFRATDDLSYHRSDPTSGWNYVVKGGIRLIDIDGDHHSIIEGQGPEKWARKLPQLMSEERAAAGTSAAVHRCAAAEESRSHVLAALAASRRGALEAEIAAYQRALAIDENQPFWVYGNFAEALFQAEDMRAASRIYEVARSRDSWPLTTLARFAPILRRHKLSKLAKEAYRVVGKIGCDHSSVALYKARFYHDLDFSREENAALDEGLKLDSENLRLLLAKGRLMYRSRNYGEALRFAERALVKNKNRGFVREFRAEILFKLGRLGEAREEAEIALSINPSRPTAQRIMAATAPSK